MEIKNKPKAYSSKSKYKPGDLLQIFQSQRRFAQMIKNMQTLLDEESSYLTPTETVYLKALVLSFNHKKDIIK